MRTSLLDKDAQLTGNSYYEDSVQRPKPSPALTGHVAADICVVGAGYAGLTAALELAERGYSVTLLDARTSGWGASGRNGGHALIGFGFTGQEALEAQLSPQDALRAWEISLEAIQQLHSRIKQHAISCDYAPGHLTLAVNARKGRKLLEWVNHVARTYHYFLQPVVASEVSHWIASKRFYCGAFDAMSGHLHPLKYCLGLACAARDAKVRFFENSPVIQIMRGEKPLVKTINGEVSCSFVVLAGSIYLDEFGRQVAPELKSRIMPVGTYLIATDVMDKSLADSLIRQRAAVIDTNLIIDYFRVTADNRLLFGGGESYSTATPLNLARRLQRRMLSVFPQLAALRVPYVWGGFVDITMNQAPDFGRLGNNIYYLQGFSGHGLALAGMAGRLAAETIAGQAERFDLLARVRHHAFPGGEWLRTPALMLGMLYYRLRDLL